jgi:DNA invertase Pin-like site-specific DNA recombinase
MTLVRTVVYCRISDDREGEEAGVTRQSEDCLALVAGHDDWQLTGEPMVDNDVSATRGDPRPCFEEIMEMVGDGLVDVVVAWTSNRFLRSRKDRMRVIELFKAKGARLVAVKGPSFDYASADGRMMADLIGAIDTGEAERVAERVARAAQQRAEQGKIHSRSAYGWKRDDPYALEPAEAAALRAAADAVVEGKSTGSILAAMNADPAVPPPSAGSRWTRTTLTSVLVNPRIAGLRVYRGQAIGQALWPPILTVPEWERVCAVLGDASRRTATSRAVVHLLVGFLYCANCGHRMGAKKNRGIYLCPYRTQRRSDWRDCDHKVAVSLAPLDALIVELVRRRLDELDLSAPDTAPSAAGRELAALEARANGIADQYAQGAMALETAEALLSAVNGRLEQARRAHAAEQRRRATVPLDAAERWAGGDLAARRSVLTALVDGIVISPARQPGNPRFDPNRVRVVWRSHR